MPFQECKCIEKISTMDRFFCQEINVHSRIIYKLYNPNERSSSLRMSNNAAGW